MSAPASPSGLRRWKWTIAFSLFSLGLLFVFYKAFGTNPHAVPFKLTGKPAPAFTLRRLDTGEAVSLEQLKGRPIVMNFWATWCGPCRMEHPVLEWGQEQFGDQVHFLGVVFEDTPENAKGFLHRAGASYPHLVDPTSGVAVDYGVAGVPETYFIDASGVIRGKYAAPIDPQTLSRRIGELVAANGAPPGVIR
ncbi:MAG: TlpA family protein disulfide reductase [Myxococcota bacterium]